MSQSTKSRLDYQQLFLAFPALYWVVCPDLILQEISAEFLHLLGRNKHEVIDHTVFDAFFGNSPENQVCTEAQLRESLNYVLQHQEPHHIPATRFTFTKNGTESEFYLKGISKPVFDENGKLSGILHKAENVTQQVMLEQEQKHDQQRLELIARATSDVIWDWDLKNSTVWWNDGYQKIFGYPEINTDANVDTWITRIHPDDREEIAHSIHQVIDSGGKNWSAEYRFLKKDGSVAYIFDRGFVLHDETGTPCRMLGAMVDQTQRRATERKLQESTLRTNQIMESLPLMAWSTNPEGEITYFNQSWYEYTGSSLQEMQNNGWQRFIHPDDLQPTLAQWENSLNTSTNLVCENRWLSKEGSYQWFLARAVPIRNKEGQITSWVGSLTNIHENKKVLQELQKAHDRFRFLAESIPQIVWSSEPDGQVDYFNQRWYDFTQLSVSETMGFGWAPAVHPDDQQTTLDKWTHSMKSGEKYEIELRLRNINTDEYRWFLARALPMKNNSGEIVKWFGTCTDIQVQKELQAELLGTKEQFEFLANTIPHLVWTTRPDGYHDYFNQRWMDYTKLSLEESIGLVWNDMLHPDDRKRAWNRWQRSLETGEYYEIEYRFKNGFDGSYRWFLGQAMPMRNEQGEIVKWFGTCTDIEDQKIAKEKLLHKNKELKKTNDDLDSFVYTASHDLKLPIINMAGIFNELTRTVEFTDPESEKLKEMFNRSLVQIQNTINDLSEIVKIQKNISEQTERIDLPELVEEVKFSIQDMIKNENARINCDFESLDELQFSRTNLKSVFYNLISNAIKYRSPAREPEVNIKTSQYDGYVVLSFSDNGIGINLDKHRKKLFQMFKRFHNHVPGSGLGLYIVNRIVQNNGGFIDIDSEVNEGTTFKIYLKLNMNTHETA